MSDPSDESAIPSAMNLQDLHEMAASNPEVSPSSMTLTDAKASTSVAGQSIDVAYDFKINYSKRLNHKIGALVNTEMLSDVKFLLGEDKSEIWAHKLILALSSPVFTSMFYSSLLESQNVIEIPDCQPVAFKALLQYLYTEEEAYLQTKDVNLSLAILYTSRKYAIKASEDICAVHLSSSINAENVFDILNSSNLHSLSILESECWGFIEENLRAVLDCHVDNMDSDVFILILKNDRLAIREVELFDYALKWMEHECDLQDIPSTVGNKMRIGEKALELIRFPTMTATEFADKVVPTGILKVEQVAKILTYICTSPENKELYAMEFSTQPRESRSMFQSFQSQVSLSGPKFITFELGSYGNGSTTDNENNLLQAEEERPRSRRSRNRSRRRNNN